ncbi:MAG: DUF2927 domain-containing protein, partial [Lachnospiraceae bacterium]|nr:DUF2927 domain-containing protein [Lachnospiraceae bacterium]
MSIFNDDRSTFNQAGTAFDEELSNSGFDAALKKAFDSGMNLDEIAYIVHTHTERIVSRHVVQYKLKKAAN